MVRKKTRGKNGKEKNTGQKFVESKTRDKNGNEKNTGQ